MINIAVFFGGRSVEHEVSIITGLQAVHALDTSKYRPVPIYIAKDGRMYHSKDMTDVSVFKDIPALTAKNRQSLLVNTGNGTFLIKYPKRLGDKEIPLHVGLLAVHGTFVEDGTIAAICESAGLPYAGCDVISGALSMDKFVSKAVMKHAGIPVPDGILVRSCAYGDKTFETVENSTSYPLIVKPVNLGSSVGISKASNRSELKNALDLAFKFALEALVEPCFTNMREINCAVLGDVEEAKTSVCERPFTDGELLSYKDKYLSNAGSAKGMGSGGREIPAKLPEAVTSEIREISLAAFKALGCSGCARVDCMIDDDTGKIYVNEINTIPGSLAFYLWEESGLKFPQLLDEMVSIALKRNRRRAGLLTAIPTNILAMNSKGKAIKR